MMLLVPLVTLNQLVPYSWIFEVNVPLHSQLSQNTVNLLDLFFSLYVSATTIEIAHYLLLFVLAIL